MNEEVEKTQETLNTLIDQKEPQTAVYSIRLIVIICVVIAALLFGLFYLLSSGVLLKENAEPIQPVVTPAQTVTQAVQPPPVNARFEIITGSVYRTVPGGQRELLVAHEDLKFTNDLSSDYKILEIVSYKISPDMNHIVVMANIGLTPYALFHRNILTGDTELVEIGEDAFWSADSRYIAVRKGQTDIGPYHILVYDTQKKKLAETEYSKVLDEDNTTYGDVLWAADKPEIVADYSLFSDYPYNQKEQGTVTIKVK